MPEEEQRIPPSVGVYDILIYQCKETREEIKRIAVPLDPAAVPNLTTQSRYINLSTQISLVTRNLQCAKREQLKRSWKNTWTYLEFANDRLYLIEKLVRPWQNLYADHVKKFGRQAATEAMEDGHNYVFLKSQWELLTKEINELHASRHACALALQRPAPQSRVGSAKDLVPWQHVLEPKVYIYGHYWMHYIQHSNNPLTLLRVVSFLELLGTGKEDSPPTFSPPQCCADCRNIIKDDEHLELVINNLGTSEKESALYERMGYVGEVLDDTNSFYSFKRLGLFIHLRLLTLQAEKVTALIQSGHLKTALAVATAGLALVDEFRSANMEVFNALAVCERYQ